MPIPTPRHAAACLAALLLLPTFASAQTVSPNPGLWEFQHRLESTGGSNLPVEIAKLAARLHELPPQLRVVVEQQLAAVGLGVGQGGALRICVSPERARGGLIREGQSEGSCTFTDVRQDGNRLSGNVACSTPASQGTFEGVVHTPEHVTAKAALDGSQGRIDLTAEARYVAADCGALDRSKLR
ncbi:MAG: DUF3617 domain-containing protein [Pigmentiphaga sp.]